MVRLGRRCLSDVYLHFSPNPLLVDMLVILWTVLAAALAALGRERLARPSHA